MSPEKPDDEGKTIIESEAGAAASRELSAPSDAVQHPEAPRIPGYRLVQPIGRGAYAQVWRGWQERTRKWVAVKVFERTSGLNWMLLQREVERLVRLDKHPYIVSLLDADLAGKTPYYVLDIIDGGSLDRLIAPRSAPDDLARLMEKVAEALAYVHAKGVIHCDLKPANILMDEQGRPRVADFGQSRVFNDSSAALGTLFYMAPEQADERGAPDVRWDVYALGATFFSLLTGSPPHAEAAGTLDGAGTVERRLQAYREAVRSGGAPSFDDESIDEDLRAIVSRCLEPDPARRYASVSEVATDLQARREGRPVSPLAARRGYRARKFIGRNRVLLAVGAAAAAALAVAGVRLVVERESLRNQLAVSFLARSQLEFLKGNPLRAISYGAHSNEIKSSHAARVSTLWYMSATAAPRMVYLGDGPGAFSADGRLVALSDPAFGMEVRDARTANRVCGPVRTRGDILVMAFDERGKSLATGTRDGEIRLWDPDSCRALTSPLNQGAAVTALAFSPDGGVLASGGANGSVNRWDARSGRSLPFPARPHANRVTALLFGAGGKSLLTVSELDDSARVWRLPEAAPVAVIGLSERVHGAAWSPDGRLIATAGGDRTVRLWDARDGKPVGRPMPHQNHVLAVAFSPDGSRLIAGGWDAQARLWDARTQQPIGRPLPVGSDVTTVAFSPDGQLVATGSADTTAQIWDSRTQTPYGRVLEHTTAVRNVQFTPDGKGLMTQVVGGAVWLWPVAPSPSWDRSLPHGSGVWDAAFNAGGTQLVTASKDGKARIWDASTGRLLQTLEHEGRVRAVAFSPDGGTVLTGTMGGRVRLWEVSSGRLKAEAEHGGQLFAARYGGDGRTVFSASRDGRVLLWDAADLKPRSGNILHPGLLNAASVSPDGRLVLTAGQDGTARLWSAATGAPIGKPMRHADDVNCAVFSPDGRLVLTGSSDLTARLWHAPSGEPVAGILMRHKDAVRAAAFAPDSKRLVTAGLDQRLRVWDAATGRIAGPLMSHAGAILSVAFSPDGKTLLTAGAERLARLWDVKTGLALRSFAHSDAVIVAAFSPDGRRVVTASSDGTARVWDTPWLMERITQKELLRLSDRATIKRINAGGDLVTISPDQWEEAFLRRAKDD